MSKVCDYHDLELVCGFAWKTGRICGGRKLSSAHAGQYSHRFEPVHRREDPEGMELTQLMPCTEPDRVTW